MRSNPIGWARTKTGLLRPIYPVAGGGDWPLIESQRAGTIYGIDAAPGASNAKGTYTEAVASLPFEVTSLMVHARPGGAYRLLVDIAIGAAAAEQVIVPDIFASAGGAARAGGGLFLPLLIPAGQRFAVRAQSNVAAPANYRCRIHIFGQGFLPSQPGGIVDAFGIAAASTQGTTLTAGSPAGTVGAYAQLVASTPRTLAGLALVFGNPSVATAEYGVEIAIGAAAAEIVILPNIELNTNGITEVSPWPWGAIPISIPAGTRLAARVQSSTATATVEVAAYGIVK